MAMLFNINLLDIDFDALNNALMSSSLETFQEESDIVDAIFSIQENQVLLLDAAEAYAEDIIANSTENISVRMDKVISSGAPTVLAGTIDIGTTGVDASSGLMHSGIVESEYSKYYWMMGDYVEILNNSVVPRTIATTIDAVMTRDILEGFFLKSTPGEVLSRCTTSFVIGTSILQEDINDKKAINYGDLQRFFFLKTDSIDLSIKIVKSPSFTLNETHIYGKRSSLPSKTIASKIVADFGVINLGDFNRDYLLVGGYILNKSSLDVDADTNAVLLSNAIFILKSTYAPKIDWLATDLRKTDRKNNAFIENIVQDVLANVAPADIRDYSSAVCMEELVYSIDKIMEELGNLRICDDD